MDRPSSGSPHSNFLTHEDSEGGPIYSTEPSAERAIRADSVLVACFGNPVAADYADFVSQGSHADALVIADEKVRRLLKAPVRLLPVEELLRDSGRNWAEIGRTESIVLFVNSRLTLRDRACLDAILDVARRGHTAFVGIISSFKVHLDDPGVIEVENYVLSRTTGLATRVVVFRPGHVLSQQSRVHRLLERFAPFFPLFPEHVGSCFIDGAEFFAAIESERLDEKRPADRLLQWHRSEKTSIDTRGSRLVGGKSRAYTLLGSNRPWCDVLAGHRTPGYGRS